MTTKTRKPKSPDRDWNEWLGEVPAEEGAEKPKRPKIHILCDACYPTGFTGPVTARCGIFISNDAPARPRQGPTPDDCWKCAAILHRERNAPCPNRDCPRRPWWKGLFR